MFTDISVGSEHNLALTEDQTVYTWGGGNLGELGLGNQNIGNLRQAQKVPLEDKIQQISAGATHSCALTA